MARLELMKNLVPPREQPDEDETEPTYTVMHTDIVEKEGNEKITEFPRYPAAPLNTNTSSLL